MTFTLPCLVYQLTRSLKLARQTGKAKLSKHFIVQLCQSVQTIPIDKVSSMLQDAEKSKASIWFSLYEPAAINIIEGNLHFCALTAALLLYLCHLGIILLGEASVI